MVAPRERGWKLLMKYPRSAPANFMVQILLFLHRFYVSSFEAMSSAKDVVYTARAARIYSGEYFALIAT